jgi:large subunit ribosomal protein L24
MGQRIKKDDMVVVISGRDKGTKGRVLRVLPGDDRVIVEGVNRVKRHQSPRRFREAGIVEKEAPIHISNVMHVDPKEDAPTRVKFGEDKDGDKVRIAVKSGAVLDG